MFNLNLKAIILGARVAVRELAKTNGSLIVTLSNSAFYPDGGGVMYVASKHGALGVVRQLAHEWAPQVRVNGVAPGATKTNIRIPASLAREAGDASADAPSDPSEIEQAVARTVPLAVYAEPQRHAGAYVLLASRRDGTIVTGAVYKTDAGLGIRGLRRVRGGDGLAERLDV
jgi:cis-2,3-dihydrobiphenyl-2,3-diol dehydrogenase